MATDTKVKKKVSTIFGQPSLWKVIFLNDNKTTIELVINLLTTIFKHDKKSAETVTMEIHNTGSGVAGIYPYEIAEQLGIEATNVARANGAPLKIKVEKE